MSGVLFRPATDRPVPAIVAMHGCGGLWNRAGGLSAREAAWAERLVATGFAVLLVDGFGSRGLGPQCRTKPRTVRPWRERVEDARRAFDLLAADPRVRPDAIALIGWSNGGSTVLAAVRPRAEPGTGDFRAAVAFYPGCRGAAEKADWSSRLDLLILIGEADDWTAAEPCRRLAAAHPDRVSIVTHPGAGHGFDAPHGRLRTVHGLAFTATGSGDAHVGPDPAARADALARVPAWLGERLK